MIPEGLDKSMENSFKSIKSLLDGGSVVGEPMTYGGCTVIPISRISFGLVSGGYDDLKKEVRILPKSRDTDGIVVLGGGASAIPMGFVVIEDGMVRYIKTDGDNVNKWLEIVQSSIKNIFKSE